MPPFSMPPLNLDFGSSATGRLQGGGTFNNGSGPWTINLSGSGPSQQSATASAGGIPQWMLLAGAAVALYLVLKK
jgi:hypothetical protein